MNVNTEKLPNIVESAKVLAESINILRGSPMPTSSDVGGAERLLENSESSFFVAYENGVSVGFCQLLHIIDISNQKIGQIEVFCAKEGDGSGEIYSSLIEKVKEENKWDEIRIIMSKNIKVTVGFWNQYDVKIYRTG